MKTKKEFKFIELFEFQKITTYLEEKHRKGLKLTAKLGYLNTFTQCEPEDYEYKIDVIDDVITSQSKSQLINLYRDFGYEYATEYGRFFFFRKKRESNFKEEENEQEELEKLERMKIQYKFYPLYLLTFLWLIFSSVRALLEPTHVYWQVFFILTLVIYLPGIALFLRAYLFFHRKYSKLKRRLQ